MVGRPVIVLKCRHLVSRDGRGLVLPPNAPPVVPMGRLVDYRTERRPQWLVITDEDVDGDREMVERLTPGQSVPMHAERGGRVIDWIPMLYRDPERGLVESPAPRQTVGATNGDTWIFDCPKCDRRPEVNEATFGKLFDAFLAQLGGNPHVASEIEFSKGQPIVDLSVLERMNTNTQGHKKR